MISDNISVKDYAVEQIIEFLISKLKVSSQTVEIFKAQSIDGAAFLLLTNNDLSELKLPMGDRKKLSNSIKEIHDNKVSSEVKSIAINNNLSYGIWLQKGYLPAGRIISLKRLLKIRDFYYDSNCKLLQRRTFPLTDEELECWQYQSNWLICPITNKHWQDSGTILGIAIYHAPRYLSDSEKKRKKNDDENRNKRNISNRGSYVKNRTDWAHNFEVYPSIPPPSNNARQEMENEQEILESKKISSSNLLGHMEVITGAAFDIDAYNFGIMGNSKLGIRSCGDRGIVNMDMQYDALNFQYFIERKEDSFERKYCTNRLSFFIDEIHGVRVFPKNIESQLSLLAYRDSTKLQKYDGTTDEAKLAHTIQYTIPKVLQAVILELYHGRSEALPIRTEHALRTYLLVHQISVRLLIHYEKAYRFLYTAVMRWVDNPFEKTNIENWSNIEEILLAASLVGIPFPVIAEPLMRRLVSLEKQNDKKRPFQDRLNSLWNANSPLFYRILYEIGFFHTSESLYELDQKYLRCAGSLPLQERERIKEKLTQVSSCPDFEHFWYFAGMEEKNTLKPGQKINFNAIRSNIQEFFEYVSENIEIWKSDMLPSNYQVKVPDIGELSDMKSPTLKRLLSAADHRLERQKNEARLYELHRGFPTLNKTNKLDRQKCNYCGMSFSVRDKLFRHLKKYVGKARMVESFHRKHFILNASSKDTSLTCKACGQVFPNLGYLHSHYKQLGVAGFKNVIISADYSKEIAEKKQDVEEEKDNECVICFLDSKNIVFNPCGHRAACEKCASSLKECPICRSNIVSKIRIYDV